MAYSDYGALVRAYKDKAWKSYRHEDGEYCFGGGWFVVGIDTPEGSYTYHYENKYWNMFDCVDLPRGKHWDGHTEADAETRLMSLKPERKTGKWIYGEEDGQDGWYCSECKGFIPWDYDYYGLNNIDFIKDFKTCPFCDSKMISYTGMKEGAQE